MAKDKAYKDKMDKIYEKSKDKKKEWMAWFELKPGYFRCIGVEKQKDVTDEMTAEEMEIVTFTVYKNPKHK